MENGKLLKIYIDGEEVELSDPNDFEDPREWEEWEIKTFRINYKPLAEEDYTHIALVLNYIMYYQYFN